MSVLISSATGNLTAAGSWSLVDATSYNNSETANTALTTSAVASSTFVPAAVAIGAVAVKLASRNVAPSGTMTVELFNSTGASIALTVTINVADLPLADTTNLQGGWIVFKFAGTVTPNGTDSYSVRAFTSVAAQVNLFSLATTNWARAIRTTTNQAPVAGDDMIVAGEHTGAGTGNSFVVTMNQTAATDYGSNTTSPVTPAIAVCKRGTLSYGVTAATNFLMQLSGHLIVYGQGTFSMGASGAEMPRNSTGILQFDCAADGDFGLIARNESALNIAGLSRTVGKDVSWALVSADAAVNATTITIDTDTGWLSGDTIAFASTDKPGVDHSESGTLSGNAGASSLAITGFAGGGGGLAFAKLGGAGVASAQTVILPDGVGSVTCLMNAEVVLVTRNVRVKGLNAGQMSFVSATPTAQVFLRWAEFTLMGLGVTGKHGVELDTSTVGSLDVRFCSFHDSEYGGLWLFPSTTDSYAATISDNIFYNFSNNTQSAAIMVNTIRVGGANWTLNRNVVVKGSGWGINLKDITGICTNNRISGIIGQTGFQFTAASPQISTAGRLDGQVIHSCNVTGGLCFNTNWMSVILKSWRIWRNLSSNSDIFQTLPPSLVDMDDFLMWGGTGGFAVAPGINIYLRNSLFASDSTNSTGAGFFLDGSTCNALLENCQFSVSAGAGGFLRPLVTDINLTTGFTVANPVRMIGRAVVFGGTTQVAPVGVMTVDAYVSIEKLGGTAGNHKTWIQGGTIAIDTVIFHTASPSQRLTPSSASIKLSTAPILRGIKVPVANAVAGKTVSVWVRKSVVGDGAAYNGNQQRLIQRANPALGVKLDTVLATAAAAAGTWEQLTGTISTPNDDGAFEFYVDCDGTAGWVNIDDWATA